MPEPNSSTLLASFLTRLFSMSCVTRTQRHLHQRILAWDHLSVSNKSQQFEIIFLVTFSSALCRDTWRSCICLPISTGTSVYRLCTLSVMHLSLVFWEDNSFLSSCQCGKDKKYRNQTETGSVGQTFNTLLPLLYCTPDFLQMRPAGQISTWKTSLNSVICNLTVI